MNYLDPDDKRRRTWAKVSQEKFDSILDQWRNGYTTDGWGDGIVYKDVLGVFAFHHDTDGIFIEPSLVP